MSKKEAEDNIISKPDKPKQGLSSSDQPWCSCLHLRLNLVGGRLLRLLLTVQYYCLLFIVLWWAATSIKLHYRHLHGYVRMSWHGINTDRGTIGPGACLFVGTNQAGTGTNLVPVSQYPSLPITTKNILSDRIFRWEESHYEFWDKITQLKKTQENKLTPSVSIVVFFPFTIRCKLWQWLGKVP